MSNWNANIPIFKDGVSKLNDSSFNPVITHLAERDQYLFEMLNDKSDKTVLISYNQPISENLLVGTPVYFDTSEGQAKLKPAICGYKSSIGHLIPEASAFVFGIVANIYSGPTNPCYGDIYVKGLVTDIDFSLILDAESLAAGTLEPGPLYLSASEAGKLTIYPSGAAIFVGYYIGDNSLVLSPNVDSLNQLYFNYRLYLKAAAAGTTSNVGSTWTIGHAVNATTDMTTKVGWVTKADAESVLQITAPNTNAKFFYSLPADAVIVSTTEDSGQPYYLTSNEKTDALKLKNALPAYPAAYTMVFLNGVLQTAYDADHLSGSYIIDENGIWWMDDQTNYVPWSGSPGAVTLQLLITKLNPNFGDSVVTSLTSLTPSVQLIGTGGQSAKSGDLTINLALPVNTVNTAASGSTVQNVAYNSETGVITAQTAPVINSIAVGPGLVLNTDTPGKAILSLSNFSLSGEVTDIEPEEVDFVYKGLHSYLRLKNPQANQKLGFIGKFRIPDSIPARTNASLKLVCFCDNASTTSDTAAFTFEYAVSSAGTSISSATNVSNFTIPGVNFTPLKQTTVYKNASNVPFFTIPYASFTAGSYVNFRITRTNSAYTNAIGILGVSWVIE